MSAPRPLSDWIEAALRAHPEGLRFSQVLNAVGVECISLDGVDEVTKALLTAIEAGRVERRLVEGVGVYYLREQA